MKITAGIKISTDQMNELISEWVDAELPLNPNGYEDSTEADRILEAQGKRFEQIVNLDEPEFRALFRAKTGYELNAMLRDGSYITI